MTPLRRSWDHVSSIKRRFEAYPKTYEPGDAPFPLPKSLSLRPPFPASQAALESTCWPGSSHHRQGGAAWGLRCP